MKQRLDDYQRIEYQKLIEKAKSKIRYYEEMVWKYEERIKAMDKRQKW